METQFRPYTKVVELTTTAAQDIPLKDSADELLECNYISVESSGSNNLFFQVAYDAPGLTTPLTGQAKADAMLGDTSGVTGGVGKSNGGVVELLLSDKDRVSSIRLSQSGIGSRLYLITYGQIQTGNPMRDNERPIGG